MYAGCDAVVRWAAEDFADSVIRHVLGGQIRILHHGQLVD